MLPKRLTAIPTQVLQPASAFGSRRPPKRNPKGKPASAAQQQQAATLRADLDVSSVVVEPSFRSAPWEAADARRGDDAAAVQLAMVSESGVCRCVLARAILERQLKDAGFGSSVQVHCRATRNYNVGEPPDPCAAVALEQRGLQAPAGFAAQQLAPAQDVVRFDMLLVMDKYTAADVLREVSVYDTIKKGGQLSRKVRRLGEFHSQLAAGKQQDGQDIEDPLYGNDHGPEEQAAVQQAADTIEASCKGLVAFLQNALQAANTEDVLPRELLAAAVLGMQEISWLVPPMLSKPAIP